MNLQQEFQFFITVRVTTVLEEMKYGTPYTIDYHQAKVTVMDTKMDASLVHHP
jgi:hypothetical protein